MARSETPHAAPVVSPEEIIQARRVVHDVYMDEKIENYIVDLVLATRDPRAAGLEDLVGLIEYGASPRASINLALASKAHAVLRRRGYVTPEDVRSVGQDVLRHRVIVTYEAEAEEVTSEQVVQQILDRMEVP